MRPDDSPPPLGPVPDERVTSAVRALLEDGLLLEVPDDRTDLFEEGLLDSLGVVELLVLLEERFVVTIPAQDLDVDDFRSVSAIAAFVTRIGPTARDEGQEQAGPEAAGSLDADPDRSQANR